jgi:stalled ribosome alternative rescue factor ArfA
VGLPVRPLPRYQLEALVLDTLLKEKLENKKKEDSYSVEEEGMTL